MRNEWAFALLLVCGVSCVPAVASGKQCSLTRLTSVELQVDPVVMLPVTLQGSKAWMTLNTGSVFSVIDGRAADALRLHSKPLPATVEMSYGGFRLDKIAVVDSFQIGTVRFRKGTELLLSPQRGPVPRYHGDPIVGTLGMDVFVHVDVDLDLAHRRLNLFSQDHCPGAVVYWSDTAASVPMQRGRLGDLYFPIELDGERIQASISTGQWNSSLRTDVSKRVFHFDQQSPGNEVETVLGHRRVYYRAMKLTAPGLKVTGARIQLLAPSKWCQVTSFGFLHGTVGYDGCGVHPLELGLSVIEKLHLYFATGEGVLYFTAADSPGQAASAAGAEESSHSNASRPAPDMPATPAK